MSGTTPLTNMGNTCYMNATLQALYACEDFRDSIITYGSELPTETMHGALGKVLHTMLTESTGRRREIKPEYLQRLMIERSGAFERGHEHDVSEFYSFLMILLVDEVHVARYAPAALHGPDMPYSVQESWSVFMDTANNTYLAEIMFGQYETSIRCSNPACGRQSKRWDSFAAVSLSIPTPQQVRDEPTIQMLIDRDYSGQTEETIEYNCHDCAARTAMRTITIAQTNDYLVLYLVRFSFNRVTRSQSKMTRKVEVNPTIAVNGQQFSLVTVVKHHGRTPQEGHYTAVCRHGDRWFNCNDTLITELRPEATTTGRSRGSTNRFGNLFDSTDAYMVYYRKVKRVPPVEEVAEQPVAGLAEQPVEGLAVQPVDNLAEQMSELTFHDEYFGEPSAAGESTASEPAALTVNINIPPDVSAGSANVETIGSTPNIESVPPSEMDAMIDAGLALPPALPPAIPPPVGTGSMDEISGTVGIANLGSTSYMSSTLQALFACAPFRQAIVRSGGEMHAQLASVFSRLRSGAEGGQNEVVYPDEFRRAFVRFSNFEDGHEYDVSEFLVFLLMLLQVESDGRSTDMFVGQCETTTVCALCRTRRHHFYEFTALNADIPSGENLGAGLSLKICVDVTYSGTNERRIRLLCEECPSRYARRLQSLAVLPDILVVLINRFVFDEQSDRTVKNNRWVSVESRLVVSGQSYALFAQINHSGDTTSDGHYTAYCLHGQLWWQCDDFRVDIVPTRSGADGVNAIYSKDALLVFYRKV